MWGSDLDLAYGPDDALAPHEATSDLVVVRPMCSLLAATGQARTPVSVCGVYALNAGAANVGPLSVKGVGALNVLGPANVSGLGGNGLFAANALVASPFVGSASGVVAFNAIVGAPHVFGATGIAVFNVLAGLVRARLLPSAAVCRPCYAPL
ncbi:hypothetical protein KFE25_013106 [Diacronema lutheri]|uniref:Uncharacterized protein n=1 Tax=Diacronema lutheri TaxID=2081491 RepID=A0A8J5X801_DIALT|nr:hypothetical protein KFE25_013106 [Diacronema lutheri]